MTLACTACHHHEWRRELLEEWADVVGERGMRAMAEEVLGSAEAANEWLNTEAMGLEFRKPIDLVSTSPGAEAVKTLLQRMKYGVYA